MDHSSDVAAPKVQFGYRLLFERNPLPMWLYDARTLAMFAVNDAALARYGYSRQEFVGLTMLDIQQDVDADEVREIFQHVAGEQLAQRQGRHRDRHGQLLEVETLTEEIEFDGVRAHMMLVKDVTEQRPVAQSGLENREILDTVISTSHDAIVIVDDAGLIKRFNPGAERIFRQSRQNVEGQVIEMLMPERFRAQHAEHRRRFTQSEEKQHMMLLGVVKGLRSDAQEIELEGVIVKIIVNNRPMMIVSVRNVTERLRLGAEFERSRTHLSELTQKLMNQERALVRRLALALHDQLGQTLAAIRMIHETILAMQADKAPAGTQQIQIQLGRLISQAIREVRQVLMDLRPPLLEEQGLSAALDNELRNRSLTQPEVDITIDAPPEVAALRWPGEVEYVAFMVVREAVENALRHSGATAIDVSLSGTPTLLQLEISDNGGGLAAGAELKNGHLGILGMHERAHAVGAQVAVESDPAHGTRVKLSWQPWDNSEPSI